MKDLNTVLSVIGKENIKFPIKETRELLATSIEALNLDNRSHNALLRNGIKTVGDIIQNTNRLIKFKGFGSKCLSRTMYEICAFQYRQLDQKDKKKYLERILELNFEGVEVNAE